MNTKEQKIIKLLTTISEQLESLNYHLTYLVEIERNR